MVRWWAAFFIAGLVSPPSSGAGIGAALAVVGLALGTAAIDMRTPRMRRDRFDRDRSVRALASFAVCGAASIIIWQTAGLARLAGDCSGARSAGSAPNARTAPAARADPRGAERSARPAGIRSLSLSGARSRLLDALEDGRLTKRARGLIGALVLDDRSGLDFGISEMYSYVGITHFLALSGMHLGAIAIPLSALLSRFIRSKRRSDIALLAVLSLYSAVAGFPASLLRALFLSVSIAVYRAGGLHADLIGSLVAGSCVLVAIDSSIAFDAGFQLSFAAVCGIALIALPLSRKAEALIPGGSGGTILKALLFPALITCSVQFMTMPLVICLFKRVSLFSPIVNVIVSLPYTALLYMGLIYVFIPFGPLRTLCAMGINPLCRFLEAAPGIFARGPHAALYRGDFNIDLYLCGAAMAAWTLQKHCPRKRMMLITGAACIALAFLVPAARRGEAGAGSVGGLPPPPVSVPRVSCRGAVFVGAAEGMIFVGDGFTSGDAYRFTRSLWAQGVRSARWCVITPSHLRRNHGLFYLLKRISVDEALCSRYLLLRDAGLSARLESQGVPVRAVDAGEVLRNGRWRLEIIGPPFPPPRRGSVAGRDAELAFRLGDGRITLLDLPSMRGYYAVP